MGKTMTRKTVRVIWAAAALALLTACFGKAAPTWQEEYDLGGRYLQEMDYEQAILAFTNAIEIDTANAQAYLGRGDSYLALARGAEGGEQIEYYRSAMADYETALASVGASWELFEKLAEACENTGNALKLDRLVTNVQDTLQDDPRFQDWLQQHGYVAAADGTVEHLTASGVEEAMAGLSATGAFEDYLVTDAARRPYLLAAVPILEKTLDDAEAGRSVNQIWGYGWALSKVYYLLYDLDKVLETRKRVYELTGDEFFAPAEHDWNDGHYNEYGQLLSYSTAEGDTGAFEYDALGRRIVSHSVVNGSAWTTTYQYGEDGRLLRAQTDDAYGSYDEFRYDGNQITMLFCMPGYRPEATLFTVNEYGAVVDLQSLGTVDE